MDSRSRDASLRAAPREGSTVISVVADGSHHGSDAYHQAQLDGTATQSGKQRSPDETSASRSHEGRMGPEPRPVSCYQSKFPPGPSESTLVSGLCNCSCAGVVV